MSHPPANADATPRARVPRITREELDVALRSDRPPALFEVLPRGYWLKNHLPGARNAPPDEAVAIVVAQVPDHDADIVLYCWDPG